LIQTVLGHVNPNDLGICHSHEHLFLAKGHPHKVHPDLWMDDYARTVQELTEFRDAGGMAIVDAQPLGCGRMERELVNASLDTGVHVIASTGFHKLAFYPDDHWIRSLNEERLAELFADELTHGMRTGTDRDHPFGEQVQQLDAKAGLIKTAVDAERMADSDKRWFLAAAAAAVETGASLMCHTEGPEQALWLSDFYEKAGVPPQKLIMCHLDRVLTKPEVSRELGRRGIYLEYDTIGRFKYHDDESEARWIVSMLEHGLEDRLLLGLDTTRARMKAYGGEIGLTYLQDQFLPLLLAMGAGKENIRKMMVDNPAQAFAVGLQGRRGLA